MWTCSIAFSQIASLKDDPSGPLRFMTARILPGCSIANIELQRKPASGGAVNGPATYPFFTHEATVSVNSFPWIETEGEFFSVIAGKFSDNGASAPWVSSLISRFALILWPEVSLWSRIDNTFFKSSTFTGVNGACGKGWDGNFDQNSAGGGKL
jgi:hypothetical protein